MLATLILSMDNYRPVNIQHIHSSAMLVKPAGPALSALKARTIRNLDACVRGWVVGGGGRGGLPAAIVVVVVAAVRLVR